MQVVFSEEAATAVAGGSGAAAVTATYPTTGADNPEGVKYLLLSPTGGPGAGKPSAPPSPPEAGVDPIATLYATKPKDVAALVTRMSELLYGERIAATQTAKIEKFLRDPLMEPKGSSSPSKPSKSGSKKESAKTEAVPPSTPAPKAPAEETKNANTLNLESLEFKARVREALHAMMCLPEYQLN
jgi:hypothetical protein